MSIFTRRNYIWLAHVARDIRHQTVSTTQSPIAIEAVDSAIGTLANALEVESTGFNKTQFLKDIFDSPL